MSRNLIEIEERIRALDDELGVLKKEVAVLKGAEEVGKGSTVGIGLENLEISKRVISCLNYAKLCTVEDLFGLLEIALANIDGMRAEDAKMVIQKIQAIMTNPNEFTRLKEMSLKGDGIAELSRQMSKNIIPALEVYEKIRNEAKEEGIKFNSIHGGVLNRIYRRTKVYVCYIEKAINSGECIVSEEFCKECVKGKHPKMYHLLTSNDNKDITLIKEAILEEIEEKNLYVNKNKVTYEYLEKFKTLVINFKE